MLIDKVNSVDMLLVVPFYNKQKIVDGVTTSFLELLITFKNNFQSKITFDMKGKVYLINKQCLGLDYFQITKHETIK